MSPVWTRRPLADYRKLFGYRCLLGRDRKISPASISALKTGFQKNELNKIAPFWFKNSFTKNHLRDKSECLSLDIGNSRTFLFAEVHKTHCYVTHIVCTLYWMAGITIRHKGLSTILIMIYAYFSSGYLDGGCKFKSTENLFLVFF